MYNERACIQRTNKRVGLTGALRVTVTRMLHYARIRLFVNGVRENRYCDYNRANYILRRSDSYSNMFHPA